MSNRGKFIDELNRHFLSTQVCGNNKRFKPKDTIAKPTAHQRVSFVNIEKCDRPARGNSDEAQVQQRYRVANDVLSQADT